MLRVSYARDGIGQTKYFLINGIGHNSRRKQIAVGGEKTSRNNHELEDEALVGLPLCGLMTFYTTRAIPLNYTEVMKCQSFLE